MDYKALIQNYCTDCKFNAPATDGEIAGLEAILEIGLPKTYQSILRQFNGFEDNSGTHFFFGTDEAIIENNGFQNIPNEFPDLYMDLSSIFLFGAVGNGDYFFFPIINGKIEDWKIYRWSHEDDSRVLVHYHFQNFIPLLFQNQSIVPGISCRDGVSGIIVTSCNKSLLAVEASGRQIWNEYAFNDVAFDAFGNQSAIIDLSIIDGILKVVFANGQIKTLSLFTGKPV